MYHRDRKAFTLVEIMVALAVGGLVLLGARALLESVSDIAERLTATVLSTDQTANGDRLLHTLFARMETGTPWAHPFGGDGRSVRFSAWCNVPSGRQMPCDVMLRFETRNDSVVLVGELTPFTPQMGMSRERLVLKRGALAGMFRYLNDPAAGGQWFSAWGDAIVTPVAVGIIVDGDTAILRVRG